MRERVITGGVVLGLFCLAAAFYALGYRNRGPCGIPVTCRVPGASRGAAADGRLSRRSYDSESVSSAAATSFGAPTLSTTSPRSARFDSIER